MEISKIVQLYPFSVVENQIMVTLQTADIGRGMSEKQVMLKVKISYSSYSL